MYRVKHLCQCLGRQITQNPTVYRPCSAVKLGRNDRNISSRQYATESFLSGGSSVYVEEMYSAWLSDPNSVHKVVIMVDNIYIDMNRYMQVQRFQ